MLNTACYEAEPASDCERHWREFLSAENVGGVFSSWFSATDDRCRFRQRGDVNKSPDGGWGLRVTYLSAFTDEENVMTVTTCTVTVNAAFLQEIKEDSQELWSHFQRLEICLLVESPPRMSRRQLYAALARLRDQLAMHFALEEAYGYFEDAIEVAPWLSSKADDLRGQHDGFYNEVCGIVDQAEQLLYHEVPGELLEEVVDRFGDFYAMFQKHESAESELIHQAFNEDLGGWD